MWGISSAPPSLRRHHTEITKAFATWLVQSHRTQDILRIFRLASALCPSTELVIDVPETKYVYKVRKGFFLKMMKKNMLPDCGIQMYVLFNLAPWPLHSPLLRDHIPPFQSDPPPPPS